jgi:hypothetical protein
MDALLLFTIWFAATIGFGVWIVWPIERIARLRKGLVRYSIADFACLFIAIQVPLGIITWSTNGATFIDDEQLLFFRRLAGILCVTGILIWWGAVRAISFCGIQRGWRRILFLGVIVPIVFYGLIPFSLLVPASFFAAFDFADGRSSGNARWIIASTVLLGCALIVCGMLNRRVVMADAPQRDSEPEA